MYLHRDHENPRERPQSKFCYLTKLQFKQTNGSTQKFLFSHPTPQLTDEDEPDDGC